MDCFIWNKTEGRLTLQGFYTILYRFKLIYKNPTAELSSLVMGATIKIDFQRSQMLYWIWQKNTTL